jgi:septation ring formation regulator EzrA
VATIKTYWPIILTVLNFAVLWICWSLKQLAGTEVQKLVDAAVAALKQADSEAEAAIDDHETRLTRAEKDVEALRDDIAKLPTKADLARLEGEVKAVLKQVERAGAGIERIEGFFLAKGVERT